MASAPVFTGPGPNSIGTGPSPTISGTSDAPAGSTIVINEHNGAELKRGTLDGSGTWHLGIDLPRLMVIVARTYTDGVGWSPWSEPLSLRPD